jgi:hypothetical protein
MTLHTITRLSAYAESATKQLVQPDFPVTAALLLIYANCCLRSIEQQSGLSIGMQH